MNFGPIFIMIAASLWAIDALIRTPLTRVLPATHIVFWEHAIGLLLLSPFFWRARKLFGKLNLTDWLLVIGLTIVSSIGGTVLFTLALEKSFGVGDFVTPLLLQKTQPLIVILLSAVFLKEKITRQYLLFAPLAILGSYLMTFGASLPQLTFTGKELVFALALGAAAAWGTGTIFSKTILKKLTFIEATCIRFFMAVPLAWAAAMLFGQQPSTAALSPEVVGRFVFIGLTTGAGALIIYYKGLATTRANVSTISELAFPLVAIAIAITPLNPYGAPQVLTPTNIIGIVILLSSVLTIALSYARETGTIIVTGKVVHGKGDGKKIGFPTANIATKNFPGIPYGVYACSITIDKKTYKAILHFGPRIVFGETKPQLEVHIFDFHRTIYEKIATVRVGNFIRSTENFASIDAMKKQIRRDIVKAKQG